MTELRRTQTGKFDEEHPKLFRFGEDDVLEGRIPQALDATDLFDDYRVFEVPDDRRQGILENGLSRTNN